MHSEVSMTERQHEVATRFERDLGSVPTRYFDAGSAVVAGPDHDYDEIGHGVIQAQAWDANQIRRTLRENGMDIDRAAEEGITFFVNAPHDHSDYAHGAWHYSGDVGTRLTQEDEQWHHLGTRIREQAVAQGSNLWVPDYTVEPEYSVRREFAHVDVDVNGGIDDGGSQIQIVWAERLDDVGLVIGFPHLIRSLGSIEAFRNIITKSAAWAIEQFPPSALGDEERRARDRERFASLARGRVEMRIAEERREIVALERTATTHSDNYLSALRQLREHKIGLDMLVAQRDGNEAASGITPESEWEALQRHAKIEDVRVTTTAVIATTTELTMTHPVNGEQAVLGKMRLHIPLAESRPALDRARARSGQRRGGGIRIINLTNARDERQHPHVGPDGACFGSIGPEIARLVVRGEVGGAIEALIQYLESFNPDDDWGRYASLWDFQAPASAESTAAAGQGG